MDLWEIKCSELIKCQKNNINYKSKAMSDVNSNQIDQMQCEGKNSNKWSEWNNESIVLLAGTLIWERG